MARERITLECTSCKQRNYMITKSKRKQGRVEYKKYCPFERKRTVHKEAK